MFLQYGLRRLRAKVDVAYLPSFCLTFCRGVLGLHGFRHRVEESSFLLLLYLVIYFAPVKLYLNVSGD